MNRCVSWGWLFIYQSTISTLFFVIKKSVRCCINHFTSCIRAVCSPKFNGILVGSMLNSDPLVSKEVIGPILSVETVSSSKEAIALANATDFGLTASLFSANGKQSIRAARVIKAGTITINCFSGGEPSTPFCGYRQSGFGGRDDNLYGYDQCTELNRSASICRMLRPETKSND